MSAAEKIENPNKPVDEAQSELLTWLVAEFSKYSDPTEVDREHARLNESYLQVPVHIGGKKDAVQKAGLMQKIEDRWNYKQRPAPKLRLLIVPA